MSSKPCSQAIEEIKEEEILKEVESDFNPQLKILINKHWRNDSDSNVDLDSAYIKGRITVSF